MPRHRGKSPASPLMQAILTAVADAGWTTHKLSDSDATWLVKMSFDGAASSYEVEIRATEGRVSCFVAFPRNVPDSRISEVAEFITLANWELRVGNFDLNWENGGDLQFRTGINVCDGQLTNQMVQSLVLDGIDEADRFYDAIMKVAFGDMTPGRAFGIAFFGDDEEDDE